MLRQAKVACVSRAEYDRCRSSKVDGGTGVSTEQYYFSRNGVRYGPVSGDQLRSLAASGKLTPQDYVWQQGMAEWAAAATVPGLFPAPALPPMARPVPP